MNKSTAPVLQVSNLKKYYQHKGGFLRAVDDVSFTISPGEIVGLIGESGSGKTTVANILLRQTKGASGVTQFLGNIISGRRIPRARRKFLYQNMQMTFQNPFASLDSQKNVFSLLTEPLRVNKVLKTEYKALFGDWKRVCMVSRLTHKRKIVTTELDALRFLTTQSKNFYTELQHKLTNLEEKWKTLTFRERAERLYEFYFLDRLKVNRDIISDYQKKYEGLISFYFANQTALRNNTLGKREVYLVNLRAEQAELRYLLRHKHTLKVAAQMKEQHKLAAVVKKDKKLFKNVYKSFLTASRTEAKVVRNDFLTSTTNEQKLLLCSKYNQAKMVARFLQSNRRRLVYLSFDQTKRLYNTLNNQAKNHLEALFKKKGSNLTVKSIRSYAKKHRFDVKKFKTFSDTYLYSSTSQHPAVKKPKKVSRAQVFAARKRLEEVAGLLVSAKREYKKGRLAAKNTLKKELIIFAGQRKVLLQGKAKVKQQKKLTLKKFKTLKKRFNTEIKREIQLCQELAKKLQKERRSLPKKVSSAKLTTKIRSSQNRADYLKAGQSKFFSDIKTGNVNNKSFLREVKVYKQKTARVRELYRLFYKPWWTRHAIKKMLLHKRVITALKEVGLKSEHAYRYPHEFSGGQRQRIVIARALISNPKVIVADEPIASLDISIQAQIVNLLVDLCKMKKIAMLFIAHDLSMVEYISHRLLIMHLGKLVEYGNTDVIFKNPVHPYTHTLFDSIPKMSNAHLPFSSTEIDLGYIQQMKKSQPRYHKVASNHFVLGTKEQLQQWFGSRLQKKQTPLKAV